MAETSIAMTSQENASQPMEPAGKPRKFTSIDFKRWQQKISFYLTTLCLQRLTSEDTPEVLERTSDKECFIILEAWRHSDFLFRYYIMSGIQDDLYNVYSGTKTSKKLWWALEHKYKIEDARIKKFFITRYPAVLEGYSNSNCITRSNEVKSISGYVFTINRGAVSWKSSKQTCIARSTIESEFIALDKAGEEAEWLQNFMKDIPYWPKLLVIAESLSEEEITGLKDMFKAMDTDNSGSITFEELKAGLRKYGYTLKDIEIWELTDACSIGAKETFMSFYPRLNHA
ncbi:hypothetical protein FXO38_00340 [Capsicum annuum]|nr:hypothetical protein FXO38_00340 [Capsicum annuum]